MYCKWEKDTIGIYILPIFGVSRIKNKYSIWAGWLYWLFTWEINDKRRKNQDKNKTIDQLDELFKNMQHGE